jgi:hypothetical protein
MQLQAWTLSQSQTNPFERHGPSRNSTDKMDNFSKPTTLQGYAVEVRESVIGNINLMQTPPLHRGEGARQPTESRIHI